MKIVLLSPKGPLYRHRTGIFRRSLRSAPLTLTTLAALVPSALHAEIEIIDEGIMDVSSELKADLIGITVITGNAPRSYELAKQFRVRGITVVLGGPHVSLMPEEALEHADSIVTGYAEKTWPQLLRDFQHGHLKKRYDMSHDFNLKNAEDLPFPHRFRLPKRSYKSIHTFEATRGCIHQCNFCVVPTIWGQHPFQKPVEHVVADILQMKSRHLIFYDLNLLADFKYAEQLFKALIPLRVKWFGLSTTLIAQRPALMDLMVASGCAGLLIGFESLAESGIQSMNKGFNHPEKYRALMLALHERGIAVNGTFVFGGEADTEAVFQEVYDFIIDTKMDLPRFSLLTPFPGTPLFKELDDQGRITSRDWSKYDGQHLVFTPKKISEEALSEGHERLWKKTYSYEGILRRMRFNPRGIPLRLAANMGYRFYAQHLHQFYNCLGGVS